MSATINWIFGRVEALSTWFWGRVKAQPVAFAGLVRGGLLVGMAFGLKMTVTQLGIVYPWVEGAVTFLTANAVTPNSTVDAKVAVALATTPP